MPPQCAASVRLLGLGLLCFALAGTLIGPPRSAAEVPAPFTPIEVDREGDRVAVQLWGRRYDFAQGPFPEAISSQGQPLFAKPPVIQARIDGQDGPLAFGPNRVERQSPDSVLLISEAKSGSATVTARTQIEYDGMLRVDFEVDAPEPIVVERFSYRFEIPNDAVTWFNHHVPYDYARQNVNKRALLDAAGEIPAGRSEFAFAPSFSLAGREIGLELWWETNRDWSRRPGVDPIRLSRNGERTQFDVTPVDTDQRVEADKPWRHEVALFPMPLRPLPEQWRSKRFAFHTGVHLLTRRDDMDYYWIAFPAHFDAIYHGLPNAKRSDRQRELRQELASKDVKYIPYAKLTAAPTGHPKALANLERWEANYRPFQNPPPDEKALLLANTDWKGGVYSYAVCPREPDYADWIREESVRALLSEKTDGLYYDFGSITRMCERAAGPKRRKKARGLDAEGRIEPEFWFYFGLRDFYKDLYEEVKKERPEALITTHTHGQPRAVGAWVDYAFIGEALNVYFRGNASHRQARANPNLYSPDYLGLPDGWLEAMTFPAVGGVTSWLPQLKWARDPKNPGRLIDFQRAFLAWILVNDAHIWHANSDFKSLAAVYRALDRFGSLDSAVVHPWFAEDRWLEVPDGLKATTYVDDDRVMMVLANTGDQPVGARLSLAARPGGGGDALRVFDAEAEGDSGRLAVDDSGRFRITVPPRDFRLLLATP